MALGDSADCLDPFCSDILALIVALYAIRISKDPETDMLTYGWKRAEILAAFFNGIFLVALSVSIIIHSIQRFIHLEGRSFRRMRE